MARVSRRHLGRQKDAPKTISLILSLYVGPKRIETFDELIEGVSSLFWNTFENIFFPTSTIARQTREKH